MTAPLPRTREAISALVPHAGAMVLLEAVTHADEDALVCLTTTHRDPANPLRQSGCLPASAAAEYAAQAVAVHGGLTGRSGAGYLVALKDFSTTHDRLDALPGPLEVSVRRRMADDNAMIYAFSVTTEGTEVSIGQLSIFLHQGRVP